MDKALRKRIWYWRTMVRLGVRAVIAVAMVGALLLTAIECFQRRWTGWGVVCLVATGVLGFYFFMVAVAFRFRVRVEMKKELLRRNCCPRCEYDLRASRGWCPECGWSKAGENVEV